MIDDRLTFDAEAHVYRWGGLVVPSVTQVIERVGLVDYSAPWFTAKAQHYGQVLHKACALIDAGVLDSATVDPRIKLDVDAYLKFRSLLGPVEVLLVEQPLYSRIYGYAGTPDVAFRSLRTKRVMVVDRKRGVADKTCAAQTAGYGQLVSENYGVPLSLIDRAALHRLNEGEPKMVLFDNRSDYSGFLGAVSVVNWADNNGIALKGDT